MSKKLFTVMGVGRSGSSVLCDLLSSHPEIICHGEIFHPEIIQLSRHSTNITYSSPHLTINGRAKNPILFLKNILKLSAEETVGFKFLHYQDSRTENTLLENKNIKKVIIKRRSILDRYVSLIVAKKTNQWINRKGFDEPIENEIQNFHVDVDDFINTSIYIRDFYNYLSKRTQNHEAYSIYYEDFLNNNQALTKLLNFLSVDPSVELNSVYQITNKGKPKDMISNYTELKSKAEDYFYLD